MVQYFSWVILLTVLLIGSVHTQEHEHGKDGIPDWYSIYCCEKEHCKPVEETDVDFVKGISGPGLLYKPTGYVFPAKDIRLSQDGRFHVCVKHYVTPTVYGIIKSATHFCAYVPLGG